jgi:hypothetical protein
VKRDQSGAVEKYASREVGIRAEKGVDYTDVFAPASSQVTLRPLFSTAAREGFEVHHLDVKTALLNGQLTEEVYLLPPPGATAQTGQVWRLHKALYVLKGAAQAWHNRLSKSLTSAGFATSQSDPCLYTTVHAGRRVYLLIHVDDVLGSG